VALLAAVVPDNKELLVFCPLVGPFVSPFVGPFVGPFVAEPELFVVCRLGEIFCEPAPVCAAETLAAGAEGEFVGVEEAIAGSANFS
jgi:hypothetical protein